ncbi:MAG: DnaJ domain-containing protein [Candidatus Aminicenantia bacterium]
MKKLLLPFLLRDIYRNKKSGIVEFKYKDIEKKLYLKKGYLIFAETNQEEEKFGKILLDSGKISEESYQNIQLYLRKDKKIGKVLVEKGIISPKDLYEMWIHQMEEIVISMFPYFDAELEFKEEEIELAREISFKISVPFLIVKGIRRMDYSPLIEELVGKGIPYLKAKEPIYFLNDFEKELLKVIDGFAPVKELLPRISLSLEDFWKSIFLLYSSGIIDFKEEGERIEEEKEERKEKERGEIPSEKERGEIPSEKEIEEVLALERELANLNYYQILRIPASATPEEIKKSYFSLAKLYHPDKFGRNVSPEVIKKAQKVFIQITKAYQALINHQKRQEYDSGESKEEGKDLSKLCEMKFRQAKTLYRQGKYKDAIALLEEAIRIKKDKGNYYLLLALAQSKIPQLHKKAEENFSEAIKLEPWNPENYVGLGLLYKSENMIIRASKQFEKALAINQDHPVAKKELELIKGEEKKLTLQDILKGDISSFFRKKKK